MAVVATRPAQQPLVSFTCGHFHTVAALRTDVLPAHMRKLEAHFGSGSPPIRLFVAQFRGLRDVRARGRRSGDNGTDAGRGSGGGGGNGMVISAACPACVVKAMIAASKASSVGVDSVRRV